MSTSKWRFTTSSKRVNIAGRGLKPNATSFLSFLWGEGKCGVRIRYLWRFLWRYKSNCVIGTASIHHFQKWWRICYFLFTYVNYIRPTGLNLAQTFLTDEERVDKGHKIKLSNDGKPQRVFGKVDANNVALTMQGPGTASVTSRLKDGTQTVIFDPRPPELCPDQNCPQPQGVGKRRMRKNWKYVKGKWEIFWISYYNLFFPWPRLLGGNTNPAVWPSP